jgi:tetratricopeptide (TPR) repeat protein
MPNKSSHSEEMEDRAIRLLEAGKFRRAERVLKQMLASDPNCLAAHFQLARVYWNTEEYECALVHARRTLRLNPFETNACLNLGLIYEFMGRDKQASYYYKRELSRHPDSGDTLFSIGRLYFDKHRWLQASKYLRRCFDLRYSFKLDDTVYKLGECYWKLRDLPSLIDVYRRYLAIAPKAPWAASNLGGALLRSGDPKNALRWLLKAKRLGGFSKNATSDLSEARRMLLKKSKQQKTITGK